MALEYKSNNALDLITPVLDEYVVWYGKLVRAHFSRSGEEVLMPEVFYEWHSRASDAKAVDGQILDRLLRIHQAMIGAADDFGLRSRMDEPYPLNEFTELTKHYEEFIQSMRLVEREQALENSGIDEKTGLRSLSHMKEDLSREMERRSRRGNPFSIALVKMNEFDPEWKKNDEAFLLMIRQVSDQIKTVLRSFDDAYYLGDEYFLLSLKHADQIGAQAAANRLNVTVTEASIKKPNKSGELSISAVLADPVQGDNIDQMIENMKKDVVDINEKGTVVQFNEVSPLQRYISSIQS
jgi:diguanylate cyclase